MLNHTNCTSEVIAKAFARQYRDRQDYIMVALKLAGHRLTNSYQLATLASQPEPEIRALVAANPNTPNGILVDLAEEKDMDVLNAVINNPNAAPDVIQLAESTMASTALSAS